MIFCPVRSARPVCWLRKAMINREHELPIARQAKALGISRGSVYYLPRPVWAADLAIMRRIDELHLDLPFAGGRMLRDLLNADGIKVGRRHVATLMNRMGMKGLYRRPNTSKPAPGHKIYPYLLRNLAVTLPNQVWAMDITVSFPMARGFVYSAAVVDSFSRRVLAWRLSITMEVEFSASKPSPMLSRAAAARSRIPIKAAKFTSGAFTDVLLESGITVSMDGKGAWRDNVFVERLWRSVKYEEVYLKAYDTVSDARTWIGRYLGFYNSRRPHSSLDRQTPDNLTSPGFRTTRQPEQDRRSTYQTQNAVPTNNGPPLQAAAA